jgi:hypothetical protein
MGHFNNTDYLIITEAPKIMPIRERIETRLHQSLAYFYPLKDRDHIQQMPEDKRLGLLMGAVYHTDQSFNSLDDLKKIIMLSRELK